MQVLVLRTHCSGAQLRVLSKPFGRFGCTRCTLTARLAPDMQGGSRSPGSAGVMVEGACRSPDTLTGHWRPLRLQ